MGVSAKRYRYNGKERDDETKLYYYGARYYAPWLGRWTAADPLAFADGVGSYTYDVRGSPVRLGDPNGRQTPESAADNLVASMSDPDLHTHMASLSPAARAKLILGANGIFALRAQLTASNNSLEVDYNSAVARPAQPMV